MSCFLFVLVSFPLLVMSWEPHSGALLASGFKGFGFEGFRVFDLLASSTSALKLEPSLLILAGLDLIAVMGLTLFQVCKPEAWGFSCLRKPPVDPATPPEPGVA